MVNMLQAFKAQLARAQEEVAFWESAVAVASDPRVVLLENEGDDGNGGRRNYGDLQNGVLQVLPEPGEPGMTVTGIISTMQSGGYSFNSKFPQVGVNEALKSLSDKHKAVSVGKNGIAKLWTKMAAGGAATIQ